MSSFRSILKRVIQIVRASTSDRSRTTAPQAPPRQGSAPPPRSAGEGAPGPDYMGRVTSEYSPSLDGDPDPGEIVWTWVPYEEDASRGKDRPVVLVGHDGAWLLALIVSSTDHANNPDYAGRDARSWMDIGKGPWDAKGRPSEVRLDRVLRIDPSAVRREGAVVPPEMFREIVAKMARIRG